jgi:hypothetical protein
MHVFKSLVSLLFAATLAAASPVTQELSKRYTLLTGQYQSESEVLLTIQNTFASYTDVLYRPMGMILLPLPRTVLKGRNGIFVAALYWKTTYGGCLLLTAEVNFFDNDWRMQKILT